MLCVCWVCTFVCLFYFFFFIFHFLSMCSLDDTNLQHVPKPLIIIANILFHLLKKFGRIEIFLCGWNEKKTHMCCCWTYMKAYQRTTFKHLFFILLFIICLISIEYPWPMLSFIHRLIVWYNLFFFVFSCFVSIFICSTNLFEKREKKRVVKGLLVSSENRGLGKMY